LVAAILIQQLRKRVERAQRDLNKLFQFILESIESVYQQEAHVLFAIVSRYSSHEMTRSTRWSSQKDGEGGIWWENCAQVSLFGCATFLDAMAADSLDAPEDYEGHDNGNVEENLSNAEQLISGRFRGLLELASPTGWQSRDGQVVKFLHRSIIDFKIQHLSRTFWNHGLDESLIDTWMCWIVRAEIVAVTLKGNGLANDISYISNKLRGLVLGIHMRTNDICDKAMTIMHSLDSRILAL
jgi:hypothetical protein